MAYKYAVAGATMGRTGYVNKLDARLSTHYGRRPVSAVLIPSPRYTLPHR